VRLGVVEAVGLDEEGDVVLGGGGGEGLGEAGLRGGVDVVERSVETFRLRLHRIKNNSHRK
jgi:hypothetical protein